MTYEQYLDRVVDVLFKEAAKDYTWEEWADKAGLARTTVYNLGMRVTQRPQLRTVFLLAKAIGVELPSVKYYYRKVA